MTVLEPNILTNILDVLLTPFMWILAGFKKPVQETHAWHAYNISNKTFPKNKGVEINSIDTKARFNHEAPLGLYHMPIFGGLKRYAVIEVSGFKDHWHVGWNSKGYSQIHRLPVKDNKLALLTGTGSWYAFALDDDGKFLTAKVIYIGELGDNRYNNIRLF